MQTFIPRYITQAAIVAYMVVLLLVTVLFFSHSMQWYFVAFGIGEVLMFFYLGNRLSKSWGVCSERKFLRNIFWWTLAIRVAFVIFSYFFYTEMTGIPFDFNAADALFYDEAARYGASVLDMGDINLYQRLQQYSNAGFSDLGYPVYLSVVYFFFDNSIIAARVIKALLSAWTVVLIYRFAQRNFGEYTARMAAILCMLMPNLIYYCGSHLKETEMVFLEMLFIERADHLMRKGRFVLSEVVLVVLTGMFLFMFRTVLAAVLFIAFFMALTLSSTRIVNWGKRLLVIVFGVALIGIGFSNRVEEEVRQVLDVDVIEQQQRNMQWRSTRGEKEGRNNRFIKYAGATVFAPMIVTMPFATTVDIYQQEGQQMLNGGYFCKNITSFFTIMALLLLIKPYNWRKNWFDGEWRRHLLPIAVFSGYLIVLVFSSFAQSERFHIPTIPLAMMFAAFGIANITPQWRSLYRIWVVLMIVANLAWVWFKLAGRGMV